MTFSPLRGINLSASADVVNGPFEGFFCCAVRERYYDGLMKVLMRVVRGTALWTLMLLLGLGSVITWGAMLGFPGAQCWVAFIFEIGQSPQRAVHWYKEAMFNGSPHAAYMLAHGSMSGKSGLPQDDYMAFIGYILAYALGVGVEPDISILGYHGAARFGQEDLAYAENVPWERIQERLDYFKREAAKGNLPFKLDEKGYLDALRKIHH